jgi:pimeloyl-ACP methyl ester carboxylesterase
MVHSGVSYGSLLGATTVAMFPDRVDKVILDGVVNPFEYYQNT